MDPLTNGTSRPDCPSWCVADHRKPGHHQGPRDAIAGLRGHPRDEITARLLDLGFGAGPQVLVGTYSEGTAPEVLQWRYLDAEQAAFLAHVIEMLAGATPAQHRDLAKGLRLAAESMAHQSEEAAGGQQ